METATEQTELERLREENASLKSANRNLMVAAVLAGIGVLVVFVAK